MLNGLEYALLHSRPHLRQGQRSDSSRPDQQTGGPPDWPDALGRRGSCEASRNVHEGPSIREMNPESSLVARRCTTAGWVPLACGPVGSLGLLSLLSSLLSMLLLVLLAAAVVLRFPRCGAPGSVQDLAKQIFLGKNNRTD
jgi:hypothetical protein